MGKLDSGRNRMGVIIKSRSLIRSTGSSRLSDETVHVNGYTTL